MATATITLSPVVPSDAVISRALSISVNSVPLPVVNLGPSDTVYTLTCNPGDVIAASDVDTNVVGPSLPGTATGTDPTPPPTAVPTTPTITIAFS